MRAEVPTPPPAQALAAHHPPYAPPPVVQMTMRREIGIETVMMRGRRQAPLARAQEILLLLRVVYLVLVLEVHRCNNRNISAQPKD